MHEYNIKTSKDLPNKSFDAVVLTVAHKEFLNLNFKEFLNENGVLYDVKGILDPLEVSGRL